MPLPLGAHRRGTGFNFAVFSRHATAVSLLLFGEPQDSVPRLTIALDPQYNRSGDIWHLEMVLGIGGWQLLETLAINCPVCHLNEGHTAFAILERSRQHMLHNGESFQVALRATRAGSLFTTHTPVAAGIEPYDPGIY